MEGAEINEMVAFKSCKSVIARDIVFKSKCMFSGRAPPGPAGGNLSAPPAPNRSDCHGREHSLVQLGPFATGKSGRDLVEGSELNEKGYFSIRHRQSVNLEVKMHVWGPGSARTAERA